MRSRIPAAIAHIEGGIIVEARVSGLPVMRTGFKAFFGFHIHENGDCSNGFANTGGNIGGLFPRLDTNKAVMIQ